MKNHQLCVRNREQVDHALNGVPSSVLQKLSSMHKCTCAHVTVHAHKNISVHAVCSAAELMAFRIMHKPQNKQWVSAQMLCDMQVSQERQASTAM